MKKGLKTILLILVAFIFSLESVKAVDFKVGYDYNKTYGNQTSTGLLVDGKRDIKLWEHNFSGNGYNDKGYCLDAMFSGGAQNTTYTVSRVLKNNKSGKQVMVYDIAEIGMLKYGYGYETISETSALGAADKYKAAVVAHRAFVAIFGYGLNPDENTINSYYGDKKEAEMADSMAFANLGAKWAAENAGLTEVVMKGAGLYSCANYSDQNCYKNFMNNKYVWYNKNKVDNEVKNYESSSIYFAAKAIFLKGLDAAADYVKNGSKDPSIEVKLNNSSTLNTKTNSITNEYIYGTINVENFDAKKGKIDNFKLDCPTCRAKGITATLEIYDNVSWTSYPGSINLLTIIKDEKDGLKSGKIQFRVNVTKNTDDEHCENAEFTISYVYNTGRDAANYKGAVLYAKNIVKGAQRFVIIAKDDASKNNNGDVADKVTGVITCAQSCDTEISKPVCSTDPNESSSYIKTNEKIKSCIINNNDDASNPYRLSSNNKQNPGISEDNPYCGVFCKEDYGKSKTDAGLMLNPIVENVVCGGYFKLKAQVKGEKDCYTGSTKTTETSKYGKNSIDVEQYIEDIVDAQVRMIQAKDDYENFKQALADIKDRDWACGGTCEGSCGTKTEYYTEGLYNGYDAIVEYSGGEKTGKVTAKSKIAGHYSDHTGKSTCGCTSVSCGKDCWTCVTTSSNCDPGTYDELANYIKGQMEAAKARAEAAYRDYKRYILDYNSCTTGWTNNFQFGHEISYTYNEFHGNDGTRGYEPYASLIEKSGVAEAGKLVADGSITEEKEIKVCTNTRATDQYECAGQVFKADVDAAGHDEYGYNPAYGSVFKKTVYTICKNVENESCKVDNRDISQASFVKKSVKKEQKYITPTVFYQLDSNGRVTVSEGFAGYRVTALENGLPISGATTGGGLFKLQISKLGEFYTDGELGRLIDYQGQYENKSVAAAQQGKAETFNGNYVCQYESPCKPKECPECILECNYEEEICEWIQCPECKLECVGCLYNFGDLQINVKTISTTNVESAGRVMGFNWLSSVTTGKLRLLSEKSVASLFGGIPGENGIENNNTTIYNNDVDKQGTSAGLAFSIKLTPSVVKYVKDYNQSDDVTNYGGYANDTLTCYDATNDNGTYKNVYCYSSFIDDLIAKYGEEITVFNRVDVSKRSNEGNSANNGQTTQANGGYFELWPGYSYNAEVLGGPSWK